MEVPGGGGGRELCTKLLLCSVLLCVCVWQVFWGPICNGILGPKEYPLRMSFGQNPSFFLEPRESPDAATVIPSRGGSKAPGSSRSFITAFFSKAQHSSPAPSSALCIGSPSRLLFQDERSQSLCNTCPAPASHSPGLVAGWSASRRSAAEWEGTSVLQDALAFSGGLTLEARPWRCFPPVLRAPAGEVAVSVQY